MSRVFWYLAAVLTAVFSSLSFAESISATAGYATTPWVIMFSGAKGLIYPDALTGCKSFNSTMNNIPLTGATVPNSSYDTFWIIGGCGYGTYGVYTQTSANECPAGYVNDTSVVGQCKATGSTYSCPSGQNWTLNGSTCTRPDCRADQVRGSDGVCTCPSGKEEVSGACLTSCPSGFHRFNPDTGKCNKDCYGDQKQGENGNCGCDGGKSKTFAASLGETLSPSGCYNGCGYSMGAGYICPAGAAYLFASQDSTLKNLTCYSRGTSNGNICNGATLDPVSVTLTPKNPLPVISKPEVTPAPANPSADPKATDNNNKNPDYCASAGGSYTVTNNVGSCSTPSASNPQNSRLSSTQDSNVSVNPDGSTTKTTTTNQSVYDPGTGTTSKSSSSTSTTYNSDGTVKSSSSSSGTGTGVGDATGQGKEPGECAKEPDSPMCKKGDLKEKGKFTDASPDVEKAKQEFKDAFNSIRDQAKSMFGSGSAAAGGDQLPCYGPMTVLGRSFSFCLSDYSSQLSLIQMAIMFMGFLLSVYIVMRGK